MDTLNTSSPPLPSWDHLQVTAGSVSGVQSASNQEPSYSITPPQDFLDMLDSEVDSLNVAEATAAMDEASPDRPKMYPHKLY